MRDRQAIAAACFFVLLTLVLTWPFSAELATHTLSRGTDMDLAVWTIGWDVHAFTHRPWAIFDANIFFPFHDTLAYSENLIGAAFIAAPVIWVTGNVVLGMNIAALFSVAASAFGAFLLARRLTRSVPASLIAGLVYGFAPPRFFRMDQLPISSVEWIPFALLALHTYFDTGKAKYLRIAIALYSLQAVTSGHGTAMLTLAIGFLLVWKWWCGEPIAPGRRIADVGLTGALALVPAVLIYIPYKLAQIEVGLKRQLDDWSVSTSSFFTSPTLFHAWVHDRLPDWTWLTGPPDAWLFPGFLPLLLAAYAVWACWPRRLTPARDRWRRLAGALDLVALALLLLAAYVTLTGGVELRVQHLLLLRSHGATPWYQLAGVLVLRAIIARKAPLAESLPGAMAGRVAARWRAARVAFNRPDHLWLYAALFLMGMWLAAPPPFGVWRVMYWMPGLNFVRVPSRFTVVGLLGLGIAAGIGFDRLTAAWARRAQLASAALVVALLIGEFASVPMPTVPFHDDTAAIDRWVGTQSEPMALLDLPLSDSDAVPRREEWTTRIMLHSMAHWKPIFVGFSGIQPPGYMTNYWKFVGFPDADSIAAARRLGITHVILHWDLVPLNERPMVAARYAEFASDVELVHVEGDGRLYRIRPASHPPGH